MDIQKVLTVSSKETHNFSKENRDHIVLLAGLGVEGDAHAGVTVKHRSRVAKDPTVLNIRQVHLIHSELHLELREKGFEIQAGEMGENITTLGIDLLNLPKGTKLKLGEEAIIELTGLRNPCSQLNTFKAGLMSACLDRAPDGQLIRKTGVMAIVLNGGKVYPEDQIDIQLPDAPHQPLEKV
jgi:MOSC domain-containing protein YiiM